MASLDRAETLISQGEECEHHKEEEEEEDVDFNPRSPSREASSSLSSEVETLDGEIVNSNTVLDGRNGKEEVAMLESIPKEESSAVKANENKGITPTLVMPDEEDDAIFKQTRARYSLESFTLDDLEAFLQETDDEDHIPDVDGEEEYRKFLAAVLHSGDAEVQSVQTGINDDDDIHNEDNDLDFEIELEEALETDDEEPITSKGHNR